MPTTQLDTSKQLISGQQVNFHTAQLFSGASGLTALAGGGQAGATPLTAAYNQVDTCASDHDSVMLPSAQANIDNGLVSVTLYNNTAHTLDVYPQSGDKIANGAANAVFSVATNKGATFFCAKRGQWGAILSA